MKTPRKEKKKEKGEAQSLEKLKCGRMKTNKKNII
jgi:hypothetical protein